MSAATKEDRACVPDFICVGAPKTATTWLYNCLRHHPDIDLSYPKDVNKLSYLKSSDPIPSDYHGAFSRKDGSKVYGEFSVLYFANEAVLARIGRSMGKTKIIVCLRNPYDQVNSYYWHLQRLMNAGDPGRSRSLAEMLSDPDSPLKRELYYARNLRRWVAAIGGSRIHVILYDDILARPGETVDELCRFLGVRVLGRTLQLPRQDHESRVGVMPRSDLAGRVYAAVYKVLILGLGIPLLKIIGIERSYALKDKLKVRQILSWIFMKNGYPSLSVSEKKLISSLIADEIKDLRTLLGKDLAAWEAPAK